jgi:hypothetical protein
VNAGAVPDFGTADLSAFPNRSNGAVPIGFNHAYFQQIALPRPLTSSRSVNIILKEGQK